LVAAAQALGLSALALTDHDTLEGLAEFVEACKGVPGLSCVPGVEIATSWYTTSLHIVGLWIDPSTAVLGDLLAGIREARARRNREILGRLGQLGVPVTAAEVEAVADGAVVGRPHIARAMAEKGYCADIRSAFSEYLGREKAAYVRRFLPMPEQAIGVIHAAGGVAVWAHPGGGYDVQPARLRQTGRALRDLGLDGIEAYYPGYSPRHQENILAVAEELGLLLSGGSDYHGDNMPGIELGTGIDGDLSVPGRILEPLRRRAARYARSPVPETEPKTKEAVAANHDPVRATDAKQQE
jgi:predicted metal-dependent phosphoesterase TrpH